MKIEFDQNANAAYFRRLETDIVDSEEVAPGILFDIDAQNQIVGIEILGIKQRTPQQISSLGFPISDQETKQLHQWFGQLALV